MSKIVTRLYESFHPEEYDLSLDLNTEKQTFSGKVVITGQRVGRPSKRLTFHQSGLKIRSAKVSYTNKQETKELKVSRINSQSSMDEVRLHFDSNIFPGTYSVEMEFDGRITNPMEGIYPCFYTENGKQKKFLATQFESHHARDAFPCIDEPEAKAVFKLSLTTDNVKSIISNTPVKSSKKNADGRITTVFEQTPRMSTYLLAFVAGDLAYKEGKTTNNTLVRVYATPDNVEYTYFALDCAVKTLEFYNDYFDIEYPLPKCDLVALPDFASGAMENWGCITFREQGLLVDPKNTSLSIMQYVANVIAHELTHQWFGNLVTMKWWTDLWLNESFASWMSYLAVDHLFPDWKVWTQFIVDEQGVALKQDALMNTHPIVVQIKHPDEIRTIFDAISYEKGASVITMLQDHIGPDLFRDGIRLYLKKHNYSNTETADLWNALNEVSGKDVAKFMDAWTTQSGYPIITVDQKSNSYRLTQKRFMLNPRTGEDQSDWPIPLHCEDLPVADQLLIKSEKLIPGNLSEVPILNSGRRGFYRTIYDYGTITRLIEAEKIQELEDVDRLGLLSDYVEAAKAGYISTLDCLELLEAYENEDSLVVWDIMSGFLGTLRLVMHDDGLRESMKPYVRRLTQAQLERLGYIENEADSVFDRQLRPIIMGMSATADNQETIKEIEDKFAHQDPASVISPNLRAVYYTTAARHGDQSTFNKLKAMHDSTSSSEEKLNLCAALTSFKQPELIEQSLAMIDSDSVRVQDVAYWLTYSLLNVHARDMTWKWIKDKWDWLAASMGKDLSFYRIPNYVARCYSDTKFLDEFKAFFDKHLSASFERPLNQAIETIEWQAEWRDRDLDSLKEFFLDQVKVA